MGLAEGGGWAMQGTHAYTHACGCRREVAVSWDGRRRSVTAWLLADEARRLGLGEDAGEYQLPPQTYAQVLAERSTPREGPCLRCDLAARRMDLAVLAGGLWEPQWWRQPAVVRAITRIARLTGGTVSQSPKSESLYVTWATGAWRISDHPWPGRPESLRHEHRAGRWYVARLVADWLGHEAGVALA